MWKYSGTTDLTMDYEKDLSQKEIDARVKFICVKAPTTTAGAPQIMAIVTEEERKDA